ncbi:MAG: helix-turn-helix transcriptional regulator [Chloroflexi bacterium]|nr:helix-turn-helix transcriptional regulator [Chloroflexota bacterium]
MKPYAQYCPIAKTAEILGDRWSILILRDMLVGTSRFNDLARGLPGISRTLLVKRLTHLRASGLVVRTDDGYQLTRAGLDLRTLVFSMAEWGARWAFPEPSEEDLDPDLLVWWIHGQVDRPGDSTAPRVVVQIEFSDPSSWYWLVIEPGDVSVCLTDPGFDVDIVMRSSLRTMYSVWMGFQDLGTALRSGDITLDGSSALVRRFPSWLRLSPVNPAVRAARRGA